jgi:hypothetical protein
MNTKTSRLIALAGALLASLGTIASPAAADDPGAKTYWRYDQQTSDYLSPCYTPFRTGVPGQYGAWGNYIDGCTVRYTCPTYVSNCGAIGSGGLRTMDRLGHRVSANMRIRLFSASGASLGWQDASCSGQNDCSTQERSFYLRPGQSASVQCNGVRESLPNTGSVSCLLRAIHNY